MSVWTEIRELDQNKLTSHLIDVLQNCPHAEPIQTILNLAEFMAHSEKVPFRFMMNKYRVIKLSCHLKQNPIILKHKILLGLGYLFVNFISFLFIKGSFASRLPYAQRNCGEDARLRESIALQRDGNSTFTQGRTERGRLSSTDNALQQIEPGGGCGRHCTICQPAQHGNFGVLIIIIMRSKFFFKFYINYSLNLKTNIY